MAAPTEQQQQREQREKPERKEDDEQDDEQDDEEEERPTDAATEDTVCAVAQAGRCSPSPQFKDDGPEKEPDEQQEEDADDVAEDDADDAIDGDEDDEEEGGGNNAATATAAGTTTTTIPTTNLVRLRFSDFTDLQTRCVLLPWIEDEGRGAVLAFHHHVAGVADEDGIEDGGEEKDAAGPGPVGMVLRGVRDDPPDPDGESGDGADGYPSRDFADILAEIRCQPPPLTLWLAPPPPQPKPPKSHRERQPNQQEEERAQEEPPPRTGLHSLADAAEDDEDDEEESDDDDDEESDDGGSSSRHDGTDDDGRVAPAGGRLDEEKKDDQSDLTKQDRQPLSGSPRHSHRKQQQPRPVSVALDYDGSPGDDDYARRPGPSTTTTNRFALVGSWGTRMRAQSERLAADAMAGFANGGPGRGAAAAAPANTNATESRPPPSSTNLLSQLQQQLPTATTTATLLLASLAKATAGADGGGGTGTVEAVDAAAAAANAEAPHGDGLRPPPFCAMYVQSALGAFLPVSDVAAAAAVGGGNGTNGNGNSGTNGHPPSRAFTLPQVTTSSLLVIRRSETEPLPTRPADDASSERYCFQWYRSSTAPGTIRDGDCDGSIGPPEDGHSSSWNSHQTNNPAGGSSSPPAAGAGAAETGGWVPLVGATSATFQPNTTLVGRRLRCVVTETSRRRRKKGGSNCGSLHARSAASSSSPVASSSSVASSASSTSTSSSSLQGGDGTNDGPDNPLPSDDEGVGGDDEDEDVTRIVVCDLSEPVRADLTMFNGARQAMGKGGAKFGNLLGRRRGGSSSGSGTTAAVTFRVEVGTARGTGLALDGDGPVSAVQVCCGPVGPRGTDYEPLTDQPLLQVTAHADPSNARHVDLIFPGLPRTVPIPGGGGGAIPRLLDYCVVDQAGLDAPRLELEVPNRMTRESLLLSLGIANYRGKPADLDNRTVLFYRDETALRTDEIIGPAAPSKEGNDDLSASTASCENADGGGSGCSSPPSSPANPSVRGSDVVPSTPMTPFFDCQSTPDDVSHQQSQEPRQPKQPPEGGAPTAAAGGDATSRPAADGAAAANTRLEQLQRELDFLRGTLARKDRIVTELQRQVTKSEQAHQKTKQALSCCEQELKQSQQDCERIQMSKRQVERALQAQHESAQKAETSHRHAHQAMEGQNAKHLERIAELEKANRTLQNEKAVLGAAVEARESKLSRLGDLQTSNDRLSEQVRQQEALHIRLAEAEAQRQRLQVQLDEMALSEAECRKDLQDALGAADRIRGRIRVEQERAASCHAQLEAFQTDNQQLKGERNSYRQKNDSLSKEIARLCRAGRSVRDIEKILADHEAVLLEAEVLRAQKRKALEDAHMYRNSYEQARAAEQLGGSAEHQDARRALERTAELERLLSEMTDYLHAKEMQMETMRQVNEALQEEIRNLARANLREDEV